MSTNISRRVSYILPSPSEPLPLLALPGLGERRRGTTAPFLQPKTPNEGVNGHAKANGHGNGWAPEDQDPFADDPSAFIPPQPVSHTAKGKSDHPRHCLGITSLAIDTSTILADSSAPGGILYSGGRDGLVASWDLGIPHTRRRGGRYEVQPGRGGRVRWEKVGDGAEMWDEDEDEDYADGENGMGNGNSNGNPEDDEWESDEEEIVPDGGWLGVDPERFAQGLSRRRANRGGVSYEDRWEVDTSALEHARPPPTVFRQSAQTHTDWVNAMLLCNNNQTVVTASSDRTIHAWSPHSTTSSAPVLVGRHRDYVKSLAWAKYPSLLFSGALDRQIAIWDVGAPNHEVPLLNIDLNKADEWGGVGLEGERGSVYALGVDPTGRLLAAGTPERVVRLWDPRVGDKSIAKLIGHSDCVRSVVVSDDGKHMLTGSSDSTIKLWSLAAHRCLHTFNHHTSSVWSLFSNHPNLERFYSGSRDGILAAVDVEQVGDISDGECVVLAREGAIEGKRGDYESKSGDEGIRCIVGMDDEYVWTATGSAEIKRWKDVGRRVQRSDKEVDGAAYSRRQSIGDIVMPVPIGLDQPFTLSQIPDGALRNKRLSVDADAGGGLPLDRTESKEGRAVAFAPPPNPREASNPGGPNGSPSGLAVSQSMRDRLNGQERRTTLSGASIAGSFMSDHSGNEEGGRGAAGSGLNGIPYDSLVSLGIPDSPYSFGFGHNAHRSGDIHDTRSVSSGRHLKADNEQKSPNQRARDEYEDREVVSEALPLRKSPDEVIAGRPGLVRSIILNDRQHVLTVDTDGEVAVWNIVKGVAVGRFCMTDVASAFQLERGVDPETAVRKHSVEVLELVKNRIEGETMVITWCAVDTKIGSLVVHLEEGRVFDAEVYADESGVPGMENAKEDTRLNLGKWALANLFRGLITAEEREVVQHSPTTTLSSLPSIPRSPEIRTIPLDRGQSVRPHRTRAQSGTFSTAGTPILNIPGLAVPATRTAIVPEEDLLSKSAPAAGSGWQSFHALRSGALPSIAQSPAVSLGGSVAQSPAESGGRDYFSLGRKRDPSPSRGEDKQPPTPGSVSGSVAATPSLTPGGSKLKLKFGKKKKETAATMEPVVETKEIVQEEDLGPKVPEREAEQLRILDTVRSHPFHPPSVHDAPPVDLPPDTAVLISEESKDAGAWVVTYRSMVKSTEEDMVPLEMNSPLWLLDYLFTGRTKVKDPVKLTFILEPVPGCGLKEMPEGTTRLSASRILRTRKIMSFIFDKLELGHARARAGSMSSAHTRITSLASRIASHPPPAAPGQAVITEHSPGHGGVGSEGSPEDTIELLCGSHVVDPKMTLATLKQYYGSGGDMLLHYRPKKGVQLA